MLQFTLMKNIYDINNFEHTVKINESALVASKANYDIFKKFLMDDTTKVTQHNGGGYLRYMNILWRVHYNNIMNFMERKGLNDIKLHDDQKKSHPLMMNFMNKDLPKAKRNKLIRAINEKLKIYGWKEKWVETMTSDMTIYLQFFTWWLRNMFDEMEDVEFIDTAEKLLEKIKDEKTLNVKDHDSYHIEDYDISYISRGMETEGPTVSLERHFEIRVTEAGDIENESDDDSSDEEMETVSVLNENVPMIEMLALIIKKQQRLIAELQPDSDDESTDEIDDKIELINTESNKLIKNLNLTTTTHWDKPESERQNKKRKRNSRGVGLSMDFRQEMTDVHFVVKKKKNKKKKK